MFKILLSCDHGLDQITFPALEGQFTTCNSTLCLSLSRVVGASLEAPNIWIHLAMTLLKRSPYSLDLTETKISPRPIKGPFSPSITHLLPSTPHNTEISALHWHCNPRIKMLPHHKSSPKSPPEAPTQVLPHGVIDPEKLSLKLRALFAMEGWDVYVRKILGDATYVLLMSPTDDTLDEP